MTDEIIFNALKDSTPDHTEDMQSKVLDPLYDKSAEFRAGYLWGIGAAADHIVDMRDIIPKAAPEVVDGAPRDRTAIDDLMEGATFCLKHGVEMDPNFAIHHLKIFKAQGPADGEKGQG